ncbi:MAG: hypothetical protein WA113_03210 [Desulfitobacteriaceae bacterium]
MSIVWNTLSWKSKNLQLLIGVMILNLIILSWSKSESNPVYVGSPYLGTITEMNSSPFLLEYNNVAQVAEVKIIIWCENEYQIEQFREILPSEKWQWEENVKYTAQGRKAISLVGQTKLDRLGELSLKKWYFDWAGRINSAGGQVYLDERILETIDVAAFLSQVGAEPKQWMLEGSTLSVAALRHGLGEGVSAGKDQVNLQLLTRSSEGHQKSVLALPTLLEEF